MIGTIADLRAMARSIFLMLPLLLGIAAQAQGNEQLLAKLRSLRESGRHDSALVLSGGALAEMDSTPTQQRFDLLYQHGVSALHSFQLTMAMQAASDAERMALQLGLTNEALKAQALIASVHYARDEYDAALDLYRRMMSAFSTTAPIPLQWSTFNQVGALHYLFNDLDSAAFYYHKALPLMGPEHARERVGLVMNLASVQAMRGDVDSARLALEAVMPDRADLPMTMQRGLMAAYGHVLYEQHDMAGAIAAYQQAEELNEASGKRYDSSVEHYGFIADAYAEVGDHEKAYAYMRLLEAAKDSFHLHASNEQAERMAQEYQADLRERDIEVLEVQGREREERLRQRDIQLYGSLALAFLALAALFLLWRNFRQKHRYAATLVALNTELREGRDRIEEINRLLRLKVLRSQMNPHFIYNCLNAIGLLVRKGDTIAASSYLDGFARLLRMVLDHSVKDQVPISEEMDFLRQYLKLESMRFEQGLSYSVEADADLLEEDVPVPALLVQPFVENAIWHGLAPRGAGSITVRFTTRDGQVVCVVEDDGVGREAAPAREHPDGSASLGLQLTNERLQLLAHGMHNTGRIRFTDLKNGSAATGTRVEVALHE